MSKGRQVHDENLVIDGLVYHCDGDVTDPKTGGINALNITTTFFEADFPEACVGIDRRHDILPSPQIRLGSRSKPLLISTAQKPKAKSA